MDAETTRRFDLLFAAWSTSTITADEFAQFQDLLRRTPGCRQRFREACYSESALHAMLLQQQHVQRQPQRDTPRQRAGARPAARRVLALAAGLLVGLLLLPVGRHLARDAAPSTDAIPLGEPIVAGATPRRFVWPTGESEVVLMPGTRLTVRDSEQVELESGRIEATIAGLPPGRRFVVRSPEALTEVLGTHFGVATSPGITHVTVRSGRVMVHDRATGTRHVLRAGEDLRLGTAIAPRP